jgi:predicted Fe-S protein YdhL (DUF1289 family)
MGAAQRLATQARLICAGLDGEVPSPCLWVCRINPASEWCEGCFRTLDEISAWSRMSDEAKRRIWQEIPVRIEACGEREPEIGDDA